MNSKSFITFSKARWKNLKILLHNFKASNKLIKVQRYNQTEFEGHVSEKYFMIAYRIFSLKSENHWYERGTRKQQLFLAVASLSYFFLSST